MPGPDPTQSILGLASVLNELTMDALDAPLTKAGIALGTFQLLSAVRAGQGRLTQTQLAERLGITPPSLCEAVRTALNKGFVEQQTKPGDSRAKVVVLTRLGAKKVDAVLSAVNTLEDRLSRSVETHDLQVTLRTLRQMIQALISDTAA